MTRIAIVTVAAARHLDEDLPFITDAAAGRCHLDIVNWDDPTVEWHGYDIVCIRSTWGYQRRLEEFLAWVDHVSTVSRLANDASVIRWNIDKRYLRDIAAAGGRIVPTRFITPGADIEVPADGEFVVKPAISAGANDTERYRSDEGDRARRHIESLLAEQRAVMIQPYVASVDERGETGLVFFGGVYSHAFRKGAILRADNESVEGLYAREDITPREPRDDELTLARQVLDVVPGGASSLAYARVDLLRGDDGPMVLELEATEPSIMLQTAPAQADRLIDVLLSMAR